MADNKDPQRVTVYSPTEAAGRAVVYNDVEMVAPFVSPPAITYAGINVGNPWSAEQTFAPSGIGVGAAPGAGYDLDVTASATNGGTAHFAGFAYGVTPTLGDNSTKLATTAFVLANAGSGGGGGGGLPSANPNTVVAGPASGTTPATAAPRALVAADIPGTLNPTTFLSSTYQSQVLLNISGSPGPWGLAADTGGLLSFFNPGGTRALQLGGVSSNNQIFGPTGIGAPPAAGYDLDVTASAANGGTGHFAKSLLLGSTASVISSPILEIDTQGSGRTCLFIKSPTGQWELDLGSYGGAGSSASSLWFWSNFINKPVLVMDGSAGNGLVGIGYSPAAGYDLDVTASAANGGTGHFANGIVAASGGNFGPLILNQTVNGQDYISLQVGGTTTYEIYDSPGAGGGLSIWSHAIGKDIFTLLSSGAVGIGTAPAAGYDLDVGSTATNGGMVHINKSLYVDAAGGAEALVLRMGNNWLRLKDSAGTDKYMMYLDVQNFGIWSSLAGKDVFQITPQGAIGLSAAPAAGYDLDVTSGAANGGTLHVAKTVTVESTGAANLFSLKNGGAEKFQVYYAAPNGLGFWGDTYNGDVLRLSDTSGQVSIPKNLVVGTTSSVGSVIEMDNAGAGTNAFMMRSPATYWAFYQGAYGSVSTNGLGFYCQTGAVTPFWLETTGAYTLTPAPGDNSTKVATTAFVATSFAPLASPAFTGTPTAPTPAVGDNSTTLATTAFVDQAYRLNRVFWITATGTNTYTPTPGTRACYVECWGAGAGSGGVVATSSNCAASGGGGSGAYCASWITGITGTYSVVIPAGGIAGTSAGGAGGNGGAGTNTSFGASLVVATSGGGGAGCSSAGTANAVFNGGSGGVLAGCVGDIKCPGSSGSSGVIASSTLACGGAGGASQLGGGVGVKWNVSGLNAGTSPPTPGSGASGVSSVGTNAASAGSAGTAGACRIWEFF